jgi:hypothetical protein
MPHTRTLLALGVALSVAAAAIACNSVLGIEQAKLEGSNITFSASSDCDAYCGDMQLACPANSDNQEYIETSSPDAGSVCMQLCTFRENTQEELPQTVNLTGAAPTDDTVACRVWHANAALNLSPEEHCPHAGPLGGGFCGTTAATACTDFCTPAVSFCPGAYAGGLQDCMNACLPDGGFPDGGYPGYPYQINGYDDGGDSPDLQTSGNTLNCRMYHLEARLSTTDPSEQMLHCQHISQASLPGACQN